MANSPAPVTVLVTNHHVIHNLNEALDATYHFSYIRSDSVDTPDPIDGKDLIPANPEGLTTCMETDRVSNIVLMCSHLPWLPKMVCNVKVM